MPDRRRDDPVTYELLYPVEQRRPFLVIEFDGLLPEQFVNLRVAAVSVGSALDDKGFEPRRGVAERGAAAHDQTLQLLLGISLVKGGAFERSHIGSDAG